MKELGLTQAQLAEKTGLSQQIMSNYINNKFKPGYDAILALSKALEVEPNWFFDGYGKEKDAIASSTTPRRNVLERLIID